MTQENTAGRDVPNACPYCSTLSPMYHYGAVCPRVRAFEYYPDGTIKRVEFKDVPEEPIPLLFNVCQICGERVYSTLDENLHHGEGRCGTAKKNVGKSPLICNHANEVPSTCTCPADCYCKENTCKFARRRTP